jgi:SpoVK/Ycf46/Vps4 family AAA+-type ATPase
MTRLSKLQFLEGCPRFNLIFGSGVTDIFLDQNGSEYNFLEALTVDLQSKGIARVLHVSPTKPVHVIDNHSEDLASQHLWPLRAEILQTGIISNIDSGPLSGGRPGKTIAPASELPKGIGDVHGLRLIDKMLNETGSHRTALIIFNTEVFLNTFESARMVNGLINEWLMLPSINQNLIFFVFLKQDIEALKDSLENLHLPDLDLNEFSKVNNVARLFRVSSPEADEIERLVVAQEAAKKIKVIKKERSRIFRWMAGEKKLLRTWINRMNEIDILSLETLKNKGWISAVGDDLRSFEEKLNDLEGLEKNKGRLLEIRDWMRFQNFSKDVATKTNLHMVFSGNPGTGKTTLARLMGELFHEYGALRSGHVIEVKGSDLVAEFVGGTGVKSNQVIDRAIDGVLFIDEAYSLSEGERGGFGQEAIENLLIRMENDRDRLVVILAGYPDKLENFIQSNPGLSRRFPVDNRFNFEDFQADALLDILKKNLTQRKLVYEDKMVECFAKIINGLIKAKRKGFGNAGEMVNLADSIERKCKSRCFKLGLKTAIVQETDIPDDCQFFLEGPRVEVETIFQQFDAFEGLEPVRNYLYSLVRLIQFDRIRKDAQKNLVVSNPLQNFIFAGNPGTGKTTVARLIGQIYKNLGLLHKGHTIEVKSADLIAGYVGQTPEKTKKIIESSLDGVLFIDEAYSLARSSAFPGGDYGTEAIDTIVKMIEDYKDRLVVILAGYPEEMSRMTSSNPGIKSRFGATVTFPDLTPANLKAILERKISNEYFSADPETLAFAVQSLELIRNRDPRTFGNAREVNNLFFYMKRKLAERVLAYEPINLDQTELPKGWNRFISSDISGYVPGFIPKEDGQWLGPNRNLRVGHIVQGKFKA